MELPIEKLGKKYELYLKLIKEKGHIDKHGFILTEACDSLLFSGLLGCLPGISTDITKAYNRHTQLWKRRPLTYEPCYPNHSKSTISRDMMLGLAWYCWINKRKDIAEQVIKTTINKWGIIGKYKNAEGFSRVIMTPGLLSTFCWISYKLGGPSRRFLRLPPAIISYRNKGYRAHLTVLHALLREKIIKKSDGFNLESFIYHKAFSYQHNRQPMNPLYSFASCHNSSAIDVLMDERFWPNERLPTTLDRKGEWLPQRDFEGSSWKPDRSWVEHTGADFLFVAALVLDII